jgi:hypothetical protein
MWSLHWIEFLDRGGTGVPLPPLVDPDDYEQYQYLGTDTFLTLPPIGGISQFKVLHTFEIVALPPDWDWTLRALRKNQIIPTGT